MASITRTWRATAASGCGALELRGVTAAAVQQAARNEGFLVNAVAPDAIRLAPPLTLTIAEADEFADALPGILTAAAKSGDTS